MMRINIDVIAGPAMGKEFTFEKPDCFLFGRALDSRISLPGDPYVSRQHFLLEMAPPECKITDLDSKNGTFVNNIRYGGRRPITPDKQQAPEGVKEVKLHDGDEIIVGDTRMLVRIMSAQKISKQDASTLSHVSTPVKRKVACIRCNKDVTAEAGLRGQVAGAEYICKACREEKAEDHSDVLQDLLEDAVEKQSVPDAPSIDGYFIEELISRGGMGMIYKARDLETGLSVVVKTMLPHVATDPEGVLAFQREIDLTRQLNHSNVVHLFTHGKADGIFYFILEYIDGMDLGQLLDSHNGPLTLDEAAPIMLGTLAGLAHAHSAKITMNMGQETPRIFTGVVHRDLKPQNVLLTRKNDHWLAKVTDFGISKSFESAGLSNMTSPGEVLGTPMYWPREQITHYKYLHPATDVFSVAAVFYEMLTRAWVREGFTTLFEQCRERKRYPGIADYMTVISGNPTIPICEQNPGIPEPVARVLDHALQEAEVPHDANKMRDMLAKLRYPDAGVFLEALVNAFRDCGLALDNFRLEETPIENQKSKIENQNTRNIVYTIAAKQVPKQQVALFVLDLVHSTEFVIDFGDTYFSTLIGQIHKIARNHSSASELIFMKNTGDGFLAVFHSMPAAFSLAQAFLEAYDCQDIHLRIALHWGKVKSGPGGDVLGREVHRVCRVEGVKPDDLVDAAEDGKSLPLLNRILITTEGRKQLDASFQSQFEPVGAYRLKGFGKPCELWLFEKVSL